MWENHSQVGPAYGGDSREGYYYKEVRTTTDEGSQEPVITGPYDPFTGQPLPEIDQQIFIGEAPQHWVAAAGGAVYRSSEFKCEQM